MRFEAKDGSVYDTQTGERMTKCVWPPHASLIANAMNRGYAIGVGFGHEEARRTFMGITVELGVEPVKKSGRRAGAGLLPNERAA
jgi:hypothetical protein